MTRRISFKTPQSVKTSEEVFPIYHIPCQVWKRSKIASKSFDTYQEYNADIQCERYQGVDQENKWAYPENVVQRDGAGLDEQKDDKVHGSAHWGKVVQRYKGIHLVFRRVQEFLNHREPGSFERNTQSLEHKPDHHEFDFAIRCDNDTHHNDGHIRECLPSWAFLA